MKTTSLILALSFAFASGAVASDSKETKVVVPEKAKKKEARSCCKETKVAMTGSYLKQTVRRKGRITDGASQVVVIDRSTIEQSGASDLKQLLVHQGVH